MVDAAHLVMLLLISKSFQHRRGLSPTLVVELPWSTLVAVCHSHLLFVRQAVVELDGTDVRVEVGRSARSVVPIVGLAGQVRVGHQSNHLRRSGDRKSTRLNSSHLG